MPRSATRTGRRHWPVTIHRRRPTDGAKTSVAAMAIDSTHALPAPTPAPPRDHALRTSPAVTAPKPRFSSWNERVTATQSVQSSSAVSVRARPSGAPKDMYNAWCVHSNRIARCRTQHAVTAAREQLAAAAHPLAAHRSLLAPNRFVDAAASVRAVAAEFPFQRILRIRSRHQHGRSRCRRTRAPDGSR